MGTGWSGIVSGMTENPHTPETPAAPAATTPAPTPGPAGPAAAPTAPPDAGAPDASSWSAPSTAPTEAAPPAPWRRFGRWITAAVLVGVLLVGGAGGFAIGRATAPEVPGRFGVERPGGRMPGGDPGELPEPPSDRSGSGSDPGSAADGTTDGSSTGTAATT